MKDRLARRSIFLIIMSILFLLAASACGSGTPATTSAPPPTSPITTTTSSPPPPTTTEALDGAALYANTCGRCHDASEIAPQVSAMSRSDLIKFISGHIGASLTPAQQAVLADYLQTNVCDEG